MTSLALAPDELCEIVDSVTAAFLQQHSTEAAPEAADGESTAEWTGEVSLTGPVRSVPSPAPAISRCGRRAPCSATPVRAMTPMRAMRWRN